MKPKYEHRIVDQFPNLNACEIENISFFINETSLGRVRREFVIPTNGPEQKYFGVPGPSAGKIILIFYRLSHMALKNCRQLYYPGKLSVLLNPLEFQEFTVVATVVDNILIIFFSPEPALIWNDFPTKLSSGKFPIFRSCDPSGGTGAPFPFSREGRLARKGDNRQKKQHEECFQ